MRKVGAHHFAYLRAVAEGLGAQEAAMRYLGLDHGHQVNSAHRALVDHLRAIARAHGKRDARLIGIVIRRREAETKPSLEDFIVDRGLEDWSQAEAQAFYREAFPEDQKGERRRRLRERQLTLLKQLEQIAVVVASDVDSLDQWLEPVWVHRLNEAGFLTLGDLRDHILQGGQWWRHVPSTGPNKAERLEAQIRMLLPSTNWDAGARRVLPWTRMAPLTAGSTDIADAAAALPRRAVGKETAPDWGEPERAKPPDTAIKHTPEYSDGLTSQKSHQEAFGGLAVDLHSFIATPSRTPADSELLSMWLRARAASPATARSYAREVKRFLIWLVHERSKALADVEISDCLAYAAFLEHIPPLWASRRNVAIGEPGWAPFRSSLSSSSRRQALVILGAFYGWLQASGLGPRSNPWLLMQRPRPEAEIELTDSRAFTPMAWSALLETLRQWSGSASRDRCLFVLEFVEATGLRASELLHAKVKDLKLHKGRVALHIVGKGRKPRVVAVPGQAASALARYFSARGLPEWSHCTPETPILGNLQRPDEALAYASFYQSMTIWMRKALRRSALPDAELQTALQASPHWLRHTFGTRALERKAPLEVVQRQLGHADPRTTMRYAKTQLERLQSEMDAVFGDPTSGPSLREDA